MQDPYAQQGSLTPLATLGGPRYGAAITGVPAAAADSHFTRAPRLVTGNEGWASGIEYLLRAAQFVFWLLQFIGLATRAGEGEFARANNSKVATGFHVASLFVLAATFILKASITSSNRQVVQGRLEQSVEAGSVAGARVLGAAAESAVPSFLTRVEPMSQDEELAAPGAATLLLQPLALNQKELTEYAQQLKVQLALDVITVALSVLGAFLLLAHHIAQNKHTAHLALHITGFVFLSAVWSIRTWETLEKLQRTK